jgi:hypothetical protein
MGFVNMGLKHLCDWLLLFYGSFDDRYKEKLRAFISFILIQIRFSVLAAYSFNLFSLLPHGNLSLLLLFGDIDFDSLRSRIFVLYRSISIRCLRLPSSISSFYRNGKIYQLSFGFLFFVRHRAPLLMQLPILDIDLTLLNLRDG